MLTIRLLQEDEIAEVYRAYMVKDFEVGELKPLTLILELKKEKLYFCYGLFDEGELRGYAFFIGRKEEGFVLLDYYAICASQRSMGYGSSFLELLSRGITEFSGIIAEVEDPEKARDENEKKQRLRRVAFYERNGFVTTTLYCSLFRHCYNIMFLKLKDGEYPDAQIHRSLDRIYHTLFNDKIYSENVSLISLEDV